MKVHKKFLVSSALGLGFLLAGLSVPARAQTYTWNNVVIMGGGFVDGIEASPAQSGLFYARTDVGGAYRWNDSTQSWTPLTDMFPMSQGNYLGIESLAPDPANANIVYAAGGMYLGSGNGVILSSTNQGNSWTVNSIGIAMGGNATGRGMGERLAVDPNLDSVLYFGSRNNGLWKSTNSASSWSQVTAFPVNGDSTFGLSFVVIDGQGGTAGSASATIFVGVAAAAGSGSNLYESTNGGAGWSLVAGGPTGLFPRHASLGPDGNLWLAYGNDYGPYNVRNVTLSGQIWKYNVAGKTWTNVTPSSNWSGNAGDVSVDAQNGQHAVISTLDSYAPDKVLATTNGGTAWTVIANPNAGYGGPWSVYNVNGAQYLYFGGTSVGTGPTNWVDALALDPFNSNRAFHGSGEGLFVSSNIQAATQPAGVTWTFYDSGLEETVPLWMPPSVNFSSTYGFLSAVGDVSGTRNTSLTAPSAGGMYSNPVFGNCNGLDFAEGNPNDFVRVGNSGTASSDVAYSTDNGQTWTPWGSAPPGYGTANQMQSVAVAADGSHVVVSPFSGYGSPAYASSLGGAWSACSGLPSGALVAADRSNAATFYATSGGTLYRSTNSGASFTSVATFSGSGAPRPCFGEPGEVWVAANGGNLYRFTNGGSTMAQITGVTSAYGVGFGKAASGQTHPAVYVIGTVGGQYGFYRCDDGVGTTWTRINDNNHQFGWLQGSYIGGDENTYGRCYLTTGGRGVIYGDLVAGATNTPTNSPSPTPTSTATRTATPTPTQSFTATVTNSPTATATFSPTASPTNSPSFTATRTATSTATNSPTASSTPTWTSTASATATSTNSRTFTATPTFTLSGTPTAAPTNSPTSSPTPTSTASSTSTPASTPTATPTLSPTGTATATRTNSPTSTGTATPTSVFTSSPTATPTLSATATATPTSSPTTTATPSPTATATATWTNSPTSTGTATPTGVFTASPTSTFTSSATATATSTWTRTPTSTSTATSTSSPSSTPTPLFTASPTSTFTSSATATATSTWTRTPTSTSTPTPVFTASPTSTFTSSATATATPTLSRTPTSTATWTPSPSSTPTAVFTASPTPTFSSTATAALSPAPTAVVFPNPATGPGPVTVQFTLPSPADSVEVMVFTTAFRKVEGIGLSNVPEGVSDVALPLTDPWGSPLADGLYYVVIRAPQGRMIVKLLILR